MKGSTEDEVIGWHHHLNGHEFEQTPGDSENREAWRAVVHGVRESQTQLSNNNSRGMVKSLTRKWEGKIPDKVAEWQGRPGPEKCDEPRPRSELKLTIAKAAY